MGKADKEDHSDQYCEACRKPHGSAVWHYRHSTKGTREFICKRGYKALKPMEQARWLSFDGGD